jgi:hypothetical protein
MIQIRPIERVDADRYWGQILAETDPVKAFGPDVDLTKAPGEHWWEIVDGTVIGMGWARRFLKNGGVVNRGHALLPAARGRRVGFGETLDALDKEVWKAYPDAKTLVIIVWSTNDVVLRKAMERRVHLGTVPYGDQSMYIFLVEARR